MMLTSLNRLKQLYGIKPENEDKDVEMSRVIQTVSRRIESYLHRNIKKQTYTQLINPHEDQMVFRPLGLPVTSITEISTDDTGLFTGDESVLSSDNYIKSMDGRDIIINAGLGVTPTRFIYIGGLAEDPTISTWVLGSLSGTPEVGDTVFGETSLAKGIVTYTSGTTLKVENFYGEFILNEPLIIGNATATLTTLTSVCLAEVAPDLALACEIQSNYIAKHLSDFENSTTERDITSRKSPNADLQSVYIFLPEVKDLLEPYRNKKVDTEIRY